MHHLEQKQEESEIFRGTITIFYKKTGGEPLFLVAENTGTGNITFIGGAEEPGDQSPEKSAQREIKEELGLNEGQYKLYPTTITHDFVFDAKKKERAGRRGSYQVFLSDVSDISEIAHTNELKSAKWMTKKEVLNSLSFQDLKDVFEKAANEIEPQNF